MFEAITYVLSKIKDGGLDKIVSSIEMKKIGNKFNVWFQTLTLVIIHQPFTLTINCFDDIKFV